MQQPIVGAFIFPHGSVVINPDMVPNIMAFPGSTPNTLEEAKQMHGGMIFAADNLMDLNPDLILISTPHGPSQDAFTFIGNAKAVGAASWVDTWTISASMEIDQEMTRLCVESIHSQPETSQVEILISGSPEDAALIGNSEVIPWWYIQNAAFKRQLPIPKAIVLGHPKSLNNGKYMRMPEVYRLGVNLSKFLLHEPSLKNKRVAIVISGNLSQCHSQAPHDPRIPYPFSPDAAVYDHAIQCWADIDFKGAFRNCQWDTMNLHLTTNAAKLVDKVSSCGFTGFIILQGLLRHYLHAEKNETLEFEPLTYHYGVPTYYGMICSSWIENWT